MTERVKSNNEKDKISINNYDDTYKCNLIE